MRSEDWKRERAELEILAFRVPERLEDLRRRGAPRSWLDRLKQEAAQWISRWLEMSEDER